MAKETSRPCILLLGTCDTKLSELLYLRSCVLQHDVGVELADVGRTPVSHVDITYSHPKLLSYLPHQPEIEKLERGQLVETMISAATALVAELFSHQAIDAIICIGGSGGTSLGASVMRSALPIGFPKVIVSTVASGNVGNFVGETDLTMMHSVVDIAGKNSILNPILENAAGMIVGAAKAYHERRRMGGGKALADQMRKERVAITMFGVTTPAADAAREHLEKVGHEVLVFHATGVGGRAMEKLVSERQIDGVLDLTTSELADELVGGIMSAGPDRLTAAARAGVPQVISLGALDMVNFGPRASVPSQFNERILHMHNPDITVMRTTKEECQKLGQQMAEKIRMHAKEPNMVRVFIPRGGSSMLSVKGGPFYDEKADAALFDAVIQGLGESSISIVEDQRAINDEGYSVEMAKTLMQLMQKSSQ